MHGQRLKWLFAVGLLLMTASLALAGGQVAARADSGTNRYQQTNLVSDIANPPGGPAAHMDANLQNPWGIATGLTTPFWVADNNAGLSTVYDGSGQTVHPPVTIPAPGGGAGAPTGIVFNPTTDDFQISANNRSGKAIFLWATEDGTIAGWNPNVNATTAIIAVDNSQNPTATNGAVYKGLALASFGGKNYLYATNFRAGTVDVFDAAFHPAHLPGHFTDPNIPAGFAPFNIQLIGDDLYVTYAKQDAAKHDDVRGPGNGFVDVFGTSGRLDRRFASRGPLNSPWGLALAPDDFGRFSGHVLVGNFGDGHITAFDGNGRSDGQLQDVNGQPLHIPFLWGLRVGNGAAGGDEDTVYFAAGLNEEKDGLFGALSPSNR